MRDLAACSERHGGGGAGAGTSRIEIEGVDELGPRDHTVVPDRVVAATYLAAVGIAGGEVVVEDGRPDHMEMLLRKVVRWGWRRSRPDGLRATAHAALAGRRRHAALPGGGHRLQALLVAMLTVADGVAIVTENLFSGRFRYVDELRRMGADIRTEGHHAVVRGVPRSRAPGARARHPGRRRARAGRAGRRGRDGGERCPAHRPGLRGPGRRAAVAGRRGDRGGEPLRRAGPATRRRCSSGPGGDRGALARLLSFVERGGDDRRRSPASPTGPSAPYVVGLTGAPGAGKSTLTDGLIPAGAWPGWPEPPAEAVAQVAVLAVDPTSPFSGGAILGDRVRMAARLDPTVFIRSMATRGHLGGLALAVPDAVRVLGAAGIGVVIVETVGVGQVEVEVAAAADTTVVVVTPGWGDSIQAAKAGLLEVADIFVINKADRPGSARGPPRPAPDARCAARGLAARDRRDGGDGGRGVGRAVGGGGPPPGPPRARACWSTRRTDRLAQELRKVLVARSSAGIDELAGRGEFTTVVKALAAGELDPYEVADGSSRMSRRSGSGTVRPWPRPTSP